MLRLLKKVWDRVYYPPEQILALRDKGVIYYCVFITVDSAMSPELPNRLRDTGLIWAWESWLNTPPSIIYPGPGPSHRPLTRLTDQTEADFISDLLDLDSEENFRFLSLLGADPDADRIFECESERYQALRTFSIEEQGPLRLVLSRLGDTHRDYVFIPHNPIPSVKRLLDYWKLSPANATARHYDNAFETFYKLE